MPADQFQLILAKLRQLLEHLPSERLIIEKSLDLNEETVDKRRSICRLLSPYNYQYNILSMYFCSLAISNSCSITNHCWKLLLAVINSYLQLVTGLRPCLLVTAVRKFSAISKGALMP